MAWSLKNKLLGSFVTLAVLPMGISGYLSYSNAEKNLRNDAIQKLGAVAILKSDLIKQYFAENQRAITDVAANPFVVDSFIGLNKSFYTLNKGVNPSRSITTSKPFMLTSLRLFL